MITSVTSRGTVGGHFVNAQGHVCSRVVSARDLRPRYHRTGRDQYEAKAAAHTARRVVLRHHAGGSIDLPVYLPIRSITRAGGEKGSHGYRDRSIDRWRVPIQRDNKSSATPTGTSL